MFATLIIATIETINAAGAIKCIILTKTLLKILPIIGSEFRDVEVAIKAIDAIKNKYIVKSSIFNNPTTSPKTIRTIWTHEAFVRELINPKIIEIKIPSRNA